MAARFSARAGVRPRVIAGVDDPAMRRLFARAGAGFAPVPTVVVRDEIASGALPVPHPLPQIRETFSAITPGRKCEDPQIAAPVERFRRENPGARGR